MAGFLIIILVVVVLIAIAWPLLSGFAARRASRAEDKVPADARPESSPLLLGASLDPGGHQAESPPEVQGAFPLHAVVPGSDRAVCGAAIREVLDESWPPSVEASCEACEETLERERRGLR